MSYEPPEERSGTQSGHLGRVRSKIGAAIMAFCRERSTFHADDLHAHVNATCGATAPASADRVLRDLRQDGQLDYVVEDRRRSAYRITFVKSAEHQGALFTESAARPEEPE